MRYRYVTNGRLKIALYDGDIVLARTEAEALAYNLVEEMRIGNKAGELRGYEYISETDRLLAIAEKILVTPAIFDYLPLTKDGFLPLNKNILIADSKCASAGLCDNTVSVRRPQLRLTECYMTPDGVVNKESPKIMQRLEVKLFRVKGTQRPIIDQHGNIIAPKKNQARK